MADHYKRLNLSEKSTSEDFKFALLEIIRKIASNEKVPSRSDVAEMVSRAEASLHEEKRRPSPQKKEGLVLLEKMQKKKKRPPYREGGHNIPLYSARVQLFESGVIDDQEWLETLTDIERQVLRLAMVCIDKHFIYTNVRIGETLGLEETSVRNTLLNINRRRNGELTPRAKSTTRYINTKGETILHGYAHYNLINVWREQGGWQSWQLANLTTYQKEILLFVTTPNEHGRYHSTEEARQKFGFSDDSQVLKTILSLIEDTSFIIDIQSKLEAALRHRSLFNPRQIAIIEGMLGALQAGVSFRGDRLAGVSRHLGLSDTACNFFLYKALPKIMGGVVE